MDDLLDHAPCGYMIFTDDGIITQVNSTLLNMLGFEAQELFGKKLETLLTIAGRIFYQTHFFPILALQQKAEEVFLTLKCHNGSELPVLINAKKRTRNDIVENHCMLIPVPHRKKFEAELIAARKTAEEALIRNELLQQTTVELDSSKIELDRQVTKLTILNEDLAEFSNVISHDMQEPVRKIAMFADIVQRENKEIIGLHSYRMLDKIRIASLRLRMLTSGLQQYMSVGLVAKQAEPCNLARIIETEQQKVTEDLPDQPVVINSSQLPVIEGYGEQLSLLFYHLIINSVQFKKEGEVKTEIRIDADIIQENSYRSTSERYRYVDFARIVFSDKGKGFDNEYRDYIFQLFKKAHTESTGLGFGLALCKRIAENHYGYITAQSAAEQGATFTILLPLKQ